MTEGQLKISLENEAKNVFNIIQGYFYTNDSENKDIMNRIEKLNAIYDDLRKVIKSLN